MEHDRIADPVRDRRARRSWSTTISTRINVLALLLARACLVAVMARLAPDLRAEHAMLARAGRRRRPTRYRPRQPPAAVARSRARRAPDGRGRATRCSRSSTSTASSSTTTASGTPPATRCSSGSARNLGARSTGARRRLPDGRRRVLHPRAARRRGRRADHRLAARRSREHGEGFTITCALRRVVAARRRRRPRGGRPRSPTGACTPRRTAAAPRPSSQSSDVLLQALSERNPELGEH